MSLPLLCFFPTHQVFAGHYGPIVTEAAKGFALS